MPSEPPPPVPDMVAVAELVGAPELLEAGGSTVIDGVVGGLTGGLVVVSVSGTSGVEGVPVALAVFDAVLDVPGEGGVVFEAVGKEPVFEVVAVAVLDEVTDVEPLVVEVTLGSGDNPTAP
jgi:hypothetical protein